MSDAAAPTRRAPLNRLIWGRLAHAIRAFTGSEVGGKARLLLTGLVLLLLVINGLNVVNSYVGRDFITAITQRDRTSFARMTLLYLAVFAASTLVAVFQRFLEERLGLLWRSWLTHRLLRSYMEHPTYYRLSDRLLSNGEIDNPDQRIAEDVRAFTNTTLSFVLLFLNGTFTAAAFSGVMWKISPLLFFVGVLYAGVGSLLAVVFGHRLVGLNYVQLDQEASFRADLVHARANAESVALSRQETGLLGRLERHLDDLIANFRRIITVNRNLGFFTTGYNYLVQIIPALIVGPMFMRGDVEFGVVTQAGMAFSQLLGAFSLIVTQFQSISSFTAVISRLGSLGQAIEQADAVTALSMENCKHGEPTVDCPICLAQQVHLTTLPAIKIREEDGRIEYENLTLTSPQDGRVLVKELSVSIPQRTRVLVVGPNQPAKLALLRVTAGIWESGSGRVVRPGRYRILFLPERPYLPPGTLRQILTPVSEPGEITDERIQRALQTFDLEAAITRVGGLDTERDWATALSLGEQQLLAVTRVVLTVPQFVILDRPRTTLSPEQLARVLDEITRSGITYVNLEDRDEERERYNAVLELGADGRWEWQPSSGDLATHITSSA